LSAFTHPDPHTTRKHYEQSVLWFGNPIAFASGREAVMVSVNLRQLAVMATRDAIGAPAGVKPAVLRAVAASSSLLISGEVQIACVSGGHRASERSPL